MTDPLADASRGDDPPIRDAASTDAESVADDAANANAGSVDRPLRAAATVSSVTFGSRLLGLVRDVTAAHVFGASWVWDAFVLAFLIPNLFRRLFGEGSLSSAFIPVYTRLRESGEPKRAGETLRATLTVAAVGLGLLVVVVVGFFLLAPAHWLAGVLDDKPAETELLRVLAPVLFPFVLLVCLTALLGAALNVHGRFAIPAAAPVVLNVVWIAAMVAIAPWLAGEDARDQIVVVAACVVVGGLLMLLLQVVPLLRLGVRLRPRLDFKDAGMRSIGARMAPTLLGAGVMQVNVLVDSLIAKRFVEGDGAVSALYYGNRLMQFPLALVGVAMATAVFPLLSRHAARNDHARLTGDFGHALRRTLFVAIPAAAGLFVIRESVLAAAFFHGAFTQQALERGAAVLGMYAIGLWAACASPVVTRGFFAIGDTATPMRWGIVAVAINVALNLVLVQTPMAEAGLALSTSITSILGLGVLTALLSRRLRREHVRSLETAKPSEPATADTELAVPAFEDARPSGLPFHRIAVSATRALIASAVMVAGCLALDAGIEAVWSDAALGDGRTLPQVVRVLAVVVAGAALYALAAWALRAPEIGEVAGPLLRRLRRRRR